MADGFQPVERTSLVDDAAEHIAERIRSGDFQPGDRLPPISEMAKSLGVGQPTIREALKQLEVMGILEIKHGSGVYIRKGQDVLLVSNPVFGSVPTKKLMIDLIDARIPVETTSAALAAGSRTPEQLRVMTDLLDEAGKNLDDDDVLNAANMSFHREIADASHNVVLAQIQDVLTNLFQREQRSILNIYGSRQKDHEEHVGILDAIGEQQPELARERMRAHLAGVRDVLEQWDPELTPIPPAPRAA